MPVHHLSDFRPASIRDLPRKPDSFIAGEQVSESAIVEKANSSHSSSTRYREDCHQLMIHGRLTFIAMIAHPPEPSQLVVMHTAGGTRSSLEG